MEEARAKVDNLTEQSKNAPQGHFISEETRDLMQNCHDLFYLYAFLAVIHTFESINFNQERQTQFNTFDKPQMNPAEMAVSQTQDGTSAGNINMSDAASIQMQ